MKQWSTRVAAVAAVVILTAGCEADDMLLDAAQLGGGQSWTVTATAQERWADLPADRVPCGSEVIARADEQVSRRDFRAADGSTVTELVLAAPGAGVDRFKRFYAECEAAGEVETEAGQGESVTVARHSGGVEVATYLDGHLIVVGGSLPEAELYRINQLARAHAALRQDPGGG